MKKILVLLLALCLLMALVACKSNSQTEPVTTTADPSHVHNYLSTEKPATCAEEGLETFICACGDTYELKLPKLDHTWGEWLLTTPALLNKDGAETRSCSACSATESKVSKENAVENSFGDKELQYLFSRWNGVDGELTAAGLLAYFSQKYDGREADPLVVSAEEMFNWLSQRFQLTEAMKQAMKQTQDATLRYNAATDSFELDHTGSLAEVQLIGYIPKGENRYTVYYQTASWDDDARMNGVWEVEMEYNLVNGAPNKYLSATKVNGVPDKVIG